MTMLYFRNLENVTITGKDGDFIKRKIVSALKQGQRDWIAIYNPDEVVTDRSVPIIAINLADLIAVR